MRGEVGGEGAVFVEVDAQLEEEGGLDPVLHGKLIMAGFRDAEWERLKGEMKPQKASRQNKGLKALALAEQGSSLPFHYMTIEAPQSLKPAKKYCDLTGFETRYMDKATGLLYHDRYVLSKVKAMSRPLCESLVGLRTPGAPDRN